MTTVTLYRYYREDGGVDVSPVKPDGTDYTTLYRLIADEGKAITDGMIVTECIDTDSVEGWVDCELPDEEGEINE